MTRASTYCATGADRVASRPVSTTPKPRTTPPPVRRVLRWLLVLTPYYDDGQVRIFHGRNQDVLPELDPADLIFADPPYGVDIEYGDSYVDEGGDAYGGWLSPIAQSLPSSAPCVLVTPGIWNVWRWPSSQWMVAWTKPGSTRRSSIGGFNEWEPILVYGKGPKRVYQDQIRLPDCVNHASDSGDHPCPKPLRLLHWLVGQFSEPGATVVDPFMGSGTTLRAAKDLGRHAIGIDVEERYCEIAAKRMAQEVLIFPPDEYPVLTAEQGVLL